MPSAEDTQHQLHGAWRMMWGARDGLRMLDLSADGFWNSFFAIVVALPAMIVGWVGVANGVAELEPDVASRLSIVLRLAVVDIGSWVLPLVGLALIAGRAGVGDRFVAYVVASNWGSAVFIWMMVPPTLLQLVWPEAADLATLVSLALFLFTLVLSWRLTNVAIDKGPGVASAVFGGMFAASLAVLFGLQGLLGLL